MLTETFEIFFTFCDMCIICSSLKNGCGKFHFLKKMSRDNSVNVIKEVLSANFQRLLKTVLKGHGQLTQVTVAPKKFYWTQTHSEHLCFNPCL